MDFIAVLMNTAAFIAIPVLAEIKRNKLRIGQQNDVFPPNILHISYMDY
jgi:hypothetical protein